ncbi:unnamed protein product [Microthlaspi erraticum]|uniref:Uncharacterized protein n=1 Tax=Microthlaspi erraticum TaxID=1685480 RepID=A0A6D2IXS8_9BRAS|nr:unnamed protein product [Microthlaspi erraticum]
MGMSKNLKVVLSLVFLVFLALVATTTEARDPKYIDYRGIAAGDHARNCDKARPWTCKKDDANDYSRGCTKENRCDRAAGIGRSL